MEILLHWTREHGFDLLGALGIIASLGFTAFTVRKDEKSRRIANLLTLTQSHRDVWKELFSNPRLERILEADTDLTRRPVTKEEEIFVTLVIQHVNIVFYTMQDELTIPPEGLRRDVWQFFSLPIPLAVWNRAKVMQNDAFAAYVESCRNWK